VTQRNIVLFKYYPPERVDVLERRMIYFSHASAFNDPFEMQPYFQPTTFAAILRVDAAGDILDTTEEQLQIEMEGPRRERAKLEDQYKHTLIFSASQEGDNILMWGHYAAGHTGFAIGFRTDARSFHQRLDGSSRNLRRVNYSYLRPAVDTVDELREQEMLLTKSSHWQYEKEWRMFESAFNSDENQSISPGVWGFRLEPDSVERVVLGARIAPETQARIMAVMNRH
jgi:hypothetical protein